MRALRAESVGRELYDAHRAALLAELARVTEECRNSNAAMRRDVDRLRDELAGERDRNSSLRRTIIASLITAGAGIVTAIIGLLA